MNIDENLMLEIQNLRTAVTNLLEIVDRHEENEAALQAQLSYVLRQNKRMEQLLNLSSLPVKDETVSV